MARAQQLQLELDPGIRSLADLKPVASAVEPVIWVERMEVHKDSPNGSETLLRRIELRKGLNILWATSQGERPGRLGGHGAGKTTFCRLLRYAIGDAKPGNRQFREDFRNSFANGWVLADVWLNGQRWLVARPLGELGHHPWALAGGTLLEPLPQSPPRGSFKEYEDALNAAVLGKMAHRKLSGSGKELSWPLLLPWLTRDQEAHYSSLTEWRAKESESEGDNILSAPDRENLMRLVLGLVDDEEQKRLREREQAAQEHERLTRERPQREYHRTQAEGALAALFKGNIGHPGDLIFEAAISNEVFRLRREADEALLLLQEDAELKGLVSDEAARNLQIDFISDRISELEDEVARQQGTVLATGHRASDAKHLSGTIRFLPFKGYCSTPLPIARRKGCPCVSARPSDDEVEQATAKIVASVAPEKERLAVLAEQLGIFRIDLERAINERNAIAQAIRSRRDELGAKADKLAAPRNRAAALEAAYRAYIRAEENVAELISRIDTLAETKTELDKTIEAHAQEHREAMSTFSSLFNAIVQAMLGKEVTGKIDFAGGKTLEPKLEFHGSFDSAALSLTKLLAFDLASLALSQFKGQCHHPRFLLHDSPREADLAAPIYISLFLAAQALEEACGDHCGFQYIVTTTEPPPDKVNGKPWLLEPVLDATLSDRRFLTVDL